METNKKLLEDKPEIVLDSGRCRDYDPPTDPDGGCETIENKTLCFLYNPKQGYCPYLHKNN